MAFLKRLFSAAFLAAAFSMSACAQGELGAAGSAQAETVVIIEAEGATHRFTVELAADDEERRVGLMHRTHLPPDAGMIFDFGDEPRQLSMWMKNTLIPLDMAFIDEKGVIRRIAADTVPRSLESIPSGAAVIAVLEVNGGTFERLGVKEGDRVRHPIFDE